MRAVTLTAPGTIAVTSDWPEPACGPDEVIVRIDGVGLCGSDLSVVSGRRAVPELPWVPGHEAHGVIGTVGSRVRGRRTGQRVVVEPNYPCLQCEFCRSGATSGCTRRRIAGISESGMLAERVAVPAAFTWPVPAGWSAEDVVCVEPLTVALNAVALARVRPGQRCLVLGAGSQGLLASLAVRQAGGVAHIADPHGGRLALAKELGAMSDDDGDYTAVIETSGAPQALEQAVERAAPGGRVVLVGQSTIPSRIPSFPLVQKRLTLRGCLIYDHPGDFSRTLAVMAEGRLRPGRTVRARFDVSDAAGAFAACAEVAGKTWISFHP